MVWDRERRETVAKVSNSTLQSWRMSRLTRDLLDARAGRSAAPEPAPVLTVFKKEERARIAGTWRIAVVGQVLLDVQGDRPFVRMNGGERVSLFPLPDGDFYAPLLDLWLGFTAAASTLQGAPRSGDEDAAGSTPSDARRYRPNRAAPAPPPMSV